MPRPPPPPSPQTPFTISLQLLPTSTSLSAANAATTATSQSSLSAHLQPKPTISTTTHESPTTSTSSAEKSRPQTHNSTTTHLSKQSFSEGAFQDELLKACGRAHGVEEVHKAIGVVGTCGVGNWKESLLLTINARPKHVSVYDLQVERGTKFGILYSPGEFPLPSETQFAEFYKTASRMLSDARYNHYEISSYCKDNFESKHNLTYWDNKPFYGFGLGSASFLDGFRFSRPKKVKVYGAYVQNLKDGVVGLSEDSFPDPKDIAMDASFRKTFGTSIVHSLGKAYRPFVESGHVVCLDGHRRVITTDRFCALLSDEEEIEETVAFIRLSDPDGFLLSNELISLAFQVIAP
ncbi:hypothetical protein CsSME_00007844 [Camellia sinensis var. sinensis]